MTYFDENVADYLQVLKAERENFLRRKEGATSRAFIYLFKNEKVVENHHFYFYVT